MRSQVLWPLIFYVLKGLFSAFAFRQHVLLNELRHMANAGRERAQVDVRGRGSLVAEQKLYVHQGRVAAGHKPL